MLNSRRICPKCKGGPFPAGNPFSVHLSQCTSEGTLFDLFPEGEDNFNRLLTEASIPSTLTQRLNEASREMKRPHVDGNTRNKSLLSSMPSIAHLAMGSGHPDALEVEFASPYDSDSFFHGNNEDTSIQSTFFPANNVETSIQSTGIPDSFDRVLYHCDLPPSVIYQIHMEHVICRHRDVDLSLLDDVNNIVQLHVSRGLDLKNSKLYSREQLVIALAEAFNMKQLKPKIVKVPTLNGYASVPVFDVKSQLLSLLHDPTIMREENFAEGYDIFTGMPTKESTQYGEVHTGWVFEQARAKFCGDDPDAFPLALTTFYDKTYVDIHGSLSCSPYIAWPANLNKKCRGQVRCARVLCYVPNLGYGKGPSSRQTSIEKLNVEHACLRTVMTQLAEIQRAGGFWTEVMGRRVRVVPWLHIASGDIVGQNDMTGHFNSNGKTAAPKSQCHCPHGDMDNPRPNCLLVTLEEVNDAYENNDEEAFASMSNHPIKSCFVGVPISCQVSGIFGITPPCILHTMGGGIMKYQFGCTRDIIGPGLTNLKGKEAFDILHQNIAIVCSHQSDNKMPRWSIRYVIFVSVCLC